MSERIGKKNAKPRKCVTQAATNQPLSIDPKKLSTSTKGQETPTFYPSMNPRSMISSKADNTPIKQHQEGPASGRVLRSMTTPAKVDQINNQANSSKNFKADQQPIKKAKIHEEQKGDAQNKDSEFESNVNDPSYNQKKHANLKGNTITQDLRKARKNPNTVDENSKAITKTSNNKKKKEKKNSQCSTGSTKIAKVQSKKKPYQQIRTSKKKGPQSPSTSQMDYTLRDQSQNYGHLFTTRIDTAIEDRLEGSDDSDNFFLKVENGNDGEEGISVQRQMEAPIDSRSSSHMVVQEEMPFDPETNKILCDLWRQAVYQDLQIKHYSRIYHLKEDNLVFKIYPLSMLIDDEEHSRQLQTDYTIMLLAKEKNLSTILNLRRIIRNKHVFALESALYEYTLADLLQENNLSQKKLKIVLVKALEGLLLLHSLEYVHSNFDPFNILISSDFKDVQITGFQSAQSTRKTTEEDMPVLAKVFQGKCNVYKPFKNMGWQTDNPNCDAYSFGIIFIEASTSQRIHESYTSERFDKYTQDFLRQCDLKVENFVKQLQSTASLSVQRIMEVFSDPYFTIPKYDVDFKRIS